MKIIRFRVEDNPQYGVIEEGESRIVALQGDPLFSSPQPSGQFYELDEVHLLSPLIPRSKAIVFPTGQGSSRENYPLTQAFSWKPNTSVIGPEDPVLLPGWVRQTPSAVKMQLCLAVAVKTVVKDLSPKLARKFVAGFTIAANYQVGGNSLWDTSCPLGPWLALGDSSFDPDHWRGRVQIDGVACDQGEGEGEGDVLGADPFAALAAVSQICTLLPGDLVLLPFPSSEDFVEVWPNQVVTGVIDGIGQIENRVLLAPETATGDGSQEGSSR